MRRTIVVDQKGCHLYSLKQMIVFNNIDAFYPVDLDTRLSHTAYFKSFLDPMHTNCCLFQLEFLNRTKSDLTYPIWSIVIVNKLFI